MLCLSSRSQCDLLCFITGSLDTIMAAYEEQKKTLQQEQESAKAKQEARIKEKLRRKKSEQMRAIQEAME